LVSEPNDSSSGNSLIRPTYRFLNNATFFVVAGKSWPLRAENVSLQRVEVLESKDVTSLGKLGEFLWIAFGQTHQTSHVHAHEKAKADRLPRLADV
jgi:hypothetical protein